MDIYTDASIIFNDRFPYRNGLGIVCGDKVYSIAIREFSKNIDELELLAIFCATRIFSDSNLTVYTDNKNCTNRINSKSPMPDIFGLHKYNPLWNSYRYSNRTCYEEALDINVRHRNLETRKNDCGWFNTFVMRYLRDSDTDVCFVKGHSGNKYNKLADKSTKFALNYANSFYGYKKSNGTDGIDAYNNIVYVNKNYTHKPIPQLYFYDTLQDCFMDMFSRDFKNKLNIDNTLCTDMSPVLLSA